MNLNFNRLATIPSGVGLATKLTTLQLANNLLTDIPEEIASIPNLREICISCNKFTMIPSTIYKCVKLEILIISNNLISAIDVDSLSSLTFLTVLDLRNNNIQVVPPKLGNMSQIKSLQLEGNGFRVPRPQILEKGTPAIMAWLRDRIPS
jgi:Leucine-rich repeat (LRR) protein